MTPTDRERFLKVLAGVHDFYGKEMSTFAAQVWLQAAQPFEIEQVTKALSAHLVDPDRGAFMPKPADLVRQLHGTHADRSLVAWGKVHDAIGRVGAYTSVVFDDASIHAAIEDMGGWPAVCRTKVDELPFLQKRFCDLHRVYSLRPGHAYPPRLSGIAEGANAISGHDLTQTAMIGDPDKARAVLENGQAGPKTAITALESVTRLLLAE